MLGIPSIDKPASFACLNGEALVNFQLGRHLSSGLGDKLISQDIGQAIEHPGEVLFDLSAGLGDHLNWGSAFHRPVR